VGCQDLLQGIFPTRDWTHISGVSCTAGRLSSTERPGKPQINYNLIEKKFFFPLVQVDVFASILDYTLKKTYQTIKRSFGFPLILFFFFFCKHILWKNSSRKTNPEKTQMSNTLCHSSLFVRPERMLSVFKWSQCSPLWSEEEEQATERKCLCSIAQ